MTAKETTGITVRAIINVPVDSAWKCWTTPKDIRNWNNASDDWHTPHAENDLRPGGQFNYRMESRDGSMGFDFGGIYNKVEVNRQIDYTIGDGRKVRIIFKQAGNQTEVVETFETESTHTLEMQREGWQAILNNFKEYAEAQSHINSKK